MEPAMASKKLAFLFLISLYFAGRGTTTLAARRLLDTPVVELPPLPSIPALPKLTFPPLPHVWDLPKPAWPPLPKVPSLPKPDLPPLITGEPVHPGPFPLSPSKCPPLPKAPSLPKPELPPFPKAIPPVIAGVPAPPHLLPFPPPLPKAPNLPKPEVQPFPKPPLITGVPVLTNPFTISPPATKSITAPANATLLPLSPEPAKPSISPPALPALPPTKVNETE